MLRGKKEGEMALLSEGSSVRESPEDKHPSAPWVRGSTLMWGGGRGIFSVKSGAVPGFSDFQAGQNILLHRPKFLHYRSHQKNGESKAFTHVCLFKTFWEGGGNPVVSGPRSLSWSLFPRCLWGCIPSPVTDPIQILSQVLPVEGDDPGFTRRIHCLGPVPPG